MYEYILEVLQVTIFGFGFDSVSTAVAPLAMAGIQIGSQVAGRGLSWLLNRGQRRRQRRLEQEARERSEASRESFDESITGLEEESALARQLANQDPDEIYGEERTRRTQEATDAVSSQLASGQTAVSRALLTTGGDISGTGATTLQKLQEGASTTLGRALSDIETDISRRSENRERFMTSRADNLQSGAVSARGQVYGNDMNVQARTGEYRLLQEQAERQMGADFGSEIADFGAKLLEEE